MHYKPTQYNIMGPEKMYKSMHILSNALFASKIVKYHGAFGMPINFGGVRMKLSFRKMETSFTRAFHSNWNFQKFCELLQALAKIDL